MYNLDENLEKVIFMSTISKTSSSHYVNWEVDGINFFIRKGTIDDSDTIVKLAQKAFFSYPEQCYYRDPATRSEYAVKDVPRRLNDPDSYTYYVCVHQEEAGQKIVGAGYLQFQKTDLQTKDGRAKAEVGQLCIDPAYQKRYGIALQLRSLRILEAKKMRIPSLYLYIIGQDPTGEFHQKGLQRANEKLGFTVTDCRYSKSMKYSRFVTSENPTGQVPIILMEMELNYDDL